MAMHVQHDWMIESIKNAVAKKTQEIAAEESEKAAERVKERVNAEVDSIALKLVQHYSVEYNGQELLIRIQKDYKNVAK